MKDVREGLSRFTVRHDRADPASSVLISSIRVTRNPRHWMLTVWNRGGRAGDLTVDAKDGPAIVDSFIPQDNQIIEEEF